MIKWIGRIKWIYADGMKRGWVEGNYGIRAPSQRAIHQFQTYTHVGWSCCCMARCIYQQRRLESSISKVSRLQTAPTRSWSFLGRKMCSRDPCGRSLVACCSSLILPLPFILSSCCCCCTNEIRLLTQRARFIGIKNTRVSRCSPFTSVWPGLLATRELLARPAIYKSAMPYIHGHVYNQDISIYIARLAGIKQTANPPRERERERESAWCSGSPGFSSWKRRTIVPDGFSSLSPPRVPKHATSYGSKKKRTSLLRRDQISVTDVTILNFVFSSSDHIATFTTAASRSTLLIPTGAFRAVRLFSIPQ